MRLLQALVDLSDLKIINSKTTDLKQTSMQWWMTVLIDGRKIMAVCSGKTRYDHVSYVKRVSLKVKTSMEGRVSPSDRWKTMDDKSLTSV